MTYGNPPVKLWLVRHGQTEWNRIGRYQGHADQPLNETGLAQAREIACRMTSDHNGAFDAVFSSDLTRARQTAEIIAASLHMPVNLDARLREIDQGEWEGLFFADLVSRFESEVKRHRGDASSGPPGGESVAEVALRAHAVADDLARTYPGGKVLVVSHGLTIATILSAVREWPLAEVYQHIPANLQVEVVSWKLN